MAGRLRRRLVGRKCRRAPKGVPLEDVDPAPDVSRAWMSEWCVLDKCALWIRDVPDGCDGTRFESWANRVLGRRAEIFRPSSLRGYISRTWCQTGKRGLLTGRYQFSTIRLSSSIRLSIFLRSLRRPFSGLISRVRQSVIMSRRSRMVFCVRWAAWVLARVASLIWLSSASTRVA